MLRPVKPVEPATFQELYEVSDANFYKVLRHTPLIIVGPLTGQEDNQSFPWVMSREDGEPVFGSFDHSFEIAPGRTREELFLGMIDYTVKCMGREKLEVKVAKTPEEMRDMVAERWPGTEIGELVEDWVTLIDKIAAAAKRTRRGDFTRRRTGLPVEDIEAALKAALDRPIEKEASCECEGRGCACCEMGKEAFDAKIEATIKKFGHMVMGVRATEPGDGPDMFYTVGLAESGLPEIVCFGLPPQDLDLLNHAAALLRRGELPLDTPIAKFTKQPVIFKAVPPERGVGYVNYANARNGRPVNLIQMVWPDKAGEYPWSAKFDNRFRAQQPCLFPAAN